MRRIVDPNQTYDSLKDLGSRLTPEEGWTFRTVVLERDLVLTPDDGHARITQDELGNTYDRVGGPVQQLQAVRRAPGSAIRPRGDLMRSQSNRLAGARNGAAVTNARRRASTPKYARSWSRVWSWPIPLDTYVRPEVVRKYLEEKARRGRPRERV